jgi:hypothetical protein
LFWVSYIFGDFSPIIINKLNVNSDLKTIPQMSTSALSSMLISFCQYSLGVEAGNSHSSVVTTLNSTLSLSINITTYKVPFRKPRISAYSCVIFISKRKSKAFNEFFHNILYIKGKICFHWTSVCSDHTHYLFVFPTNNFVYELVQNIVLN